MSVWRNITTLEFVLLNLVGKEIRLQSRPKNYMFGTLNYGEVCNNWFNEADGDRWDVFVPGYLKSLPIGTYTVSSIIGVLKLENNNHKIAVRLQDKVNEYESTYCELRCSTEIHRYVKTYKKRMGVNGTFTYVTYPNCIS